MNVSILGGMGPDGPKVPPELDNEAVPHGPKIPRDLTEF